MTGEPWHQYKAPNGHLSLELPADWTIDEQPEIVAFCEPDNGACIALIAFTRPFSTLAEFAEAKLRVESYYRPLSGPTPIHGPAWEGSSLRILPINGRPWWKVWGH